MVNGRLSDKESIFKSGYYRWGFVISGTHDDALWNELICLKSGQNGNMGSLNTFERHL
ncbi:hypothetical protein ACKVWE_008900 [Pyricularia oryzae]